MKADERRIKFYDLDIKASIVYRKNSVFVQPLKLISILIAAQKLMSQNVVIEISDKKETEFLHLVQIKIAPDRKKAIILINRSDTKAADLAISNRGRSGWRVATKAGGEGNTYSCHIAFNLDAKQGLYQMVMEDVPGVGLVRVQRLLTRICRLARASKSLSFYHKSPGGELDKNGAAKLLGAHYKFDILAHPSLDFIRELQKGKLDGIELVNIKPEARVWDEYRSTKFKGSFIKLSPVAEPESDWWSVVKSVVATAKSENMTEVKVRFTDTHKATHTVRLDPDDSSLINEEHFVKKVFINNFSSRLDTGFKQIHPEIEQKMLYLIR